VPEKTGYATDIPQGYTPRTYGDQHYAEYANGDRIRLLNPFEESKKKLSDFYQANKDQCDSQCGGNNLGKFFMYVIESYIKSESKP